MVSVSPEATSEPKMRMVKISSLLRSPPTLGSTASKPKVGSALGSAGWPDSTGAPDWTGPGGSTGFFTQRLYSTVTAAAADITAASTSITIIISRSFCFRACWGLRDWPVVISSRFPAPPWP